MHYRTIEDMNQIILRNLGRIPRDVDLVVGIPRSGLLAANMIALYLNLPLTDLEGLKQGRLIGKGKRFVPNYGNDIRDAGRILVVDDCISQGTEIARARSVISDLGISGKTTFLTVFSFPENPNKVDIVLQVIPRPMCFQWSFMHTPELKYYCLDIDGIVCVDATKEEDDDGRQYQNFLQNARSLFLPTAEVGWLVTCRLEKYRKSTEQWLEDHNVKFGELIMMDYPSKGERERHKQHSHFKADVYKRTGAMLFIESCPAMAQQIAALSGKPVMSLRSNKVIGNGHMDKYEIAVQKAFKQYRRLKRAPRKMVALLSGSGKNEKTVVKEN